MPTLNLGRAIVVVAFSLLAFVANAATKRIDVKHFDGLFASDGLMVNVQCGQKARVILQSKKANLDKVSVLVSDNMLNISRAIGRGDVLATVITPTPLTVVKAKNGVHVSVKPCAVGPDRFDVTLSNGVSVKIAGKTKLLNLQQTRGVSFDGNDLKVDHVKLNASVGTSVKLCEAKSVSGLLRLGSTVYVDDDADTSSLKTSLGTSKHGC